MRLILDTNVVLDWLLFELPALDPLRAALLDRRATIITHALIFKELALVLERPQLERYVTDPLAVLDRYREKTTVIDLESALILDQAALPGTFPRCRDPDDDKFLALAWHAKVDALVSKDKALLKLKRKCRPFGFEVLRPDEMLRALS
jgi:putative PIN family toxin of toxin-antitoxin system